MPQHDAKCRLKEVLPLRYTSSAIEDSLIISGVLCDVTTFMRCRFVGLIKYSIDFADFTAPAVADIRIQPMRTGEQLSETWINKWPTRIEQTETQNQNKLWAQNTATALIRAPQPSNSSAQTILPDCDRSWSGTWRSASRWKWSTVTPTSSSACPLTQTAACWPPAAKTRRCESSSHAPGRSSRWEEGMLVCLTNREGTAAAVCYGGNRHKLTFTIYYSCPLFLSRSWAPLSSSILF